MKELYSSLHMPLIYMVGAEITKWNYSTFSVYFIPRYSLGTRIKSFPLDSIAPFFITKTSLAIRSPFM